MAAFSPESPTHRALAWLVMAMALAIGGGAFSGIAAGHPLPPVIADFTRQHCLKCHGGDKSEGGLDFDLFTTEADVLARPRLWLDAVELTESGEMPEKGPPVPEAEIASFAKAVRDLLAEAGADRFQSAGRVTLPRLTKTEYRNTLRDLMGVDLHAGASLPDEGPGATGFRNDREALGLTAPQLEAWLEAAERAVEGWLSLEKEPETLLASEAETLERSEPRMEAHEGGMVLAHPNQELSASVVVPRDGWYVISQRAAALGRATELRLLAGGETLATAPVSPSSLAKADDVAVTVFLPRGSHNLAWQNRNLVPQIPLPPDMTRLAEEEGKKKAPMMPPFIQPESEAVRETRQRLNSQAGSGQAYYEWLRRLGPGGDPREIDRFRKYIGQKQALQDTLMQRLAALTGHPREHIERLWRNANAERLTDNSALLSAAAGVRWEDWMEHQGKLWLDRVSIRGPVLPPGSHLQAAPSFTAGEALPLQAFLRRAWRRPAAPEEAARLKAYYLDQVNAGASPDEARGATLAGALVSPHLLYRPEFAPPGTDEKDTTTPLSDHALASRLSYFLWQSLPDPALDAAADGGTLTSDPQALARETDRLLDDPRSDSFLREFILDWLRLDDLGRGLGPDPAIVPEFTPGLAEAMRQEPVAFWTDLVRNNGSVLDLLDSRHTWSNAALSRHLGLPVPNGDGFHRVELPDRRRGGLLGMAGVLTATSSPTRTNPVRRGAWVLEILLGEDPGEPLPDAGQLPPEAGETRGRTLREELTLHRERPGCARCHDKIDPPGFALEHFDLAGRWRDTEAGKPVDATGALPGGGTITGLEGLREELLSRRDDFVRHLTRRLMAHALGRKVSYQDTAAIDRIVADAKADGYRTRLLIHGIVRSDAFRQRADAGTSH